MTTIVHYLSYLAQLFLEREALYTKFVEELKIHILY